MGGVLPPAERRGSALVGLYAALSILMLLVGDRIPAAALRATGAWLFAPFDKVVLTVDRMAAAWRENQNLHERVTRLELENLKLRQSGIENAKLRQMLDLPPWRDLKLKPAEVLALAGEAVPTAATLSAGRNDGIREGDVAVTEEGLVGRISEVYPTLSRAVLLTDPNSAVACEVESTGVLGVVRFVSVPRPQLVLTGVPLSDTLRAGQHVLTSGMSRRYPRGIAVGTVVRVERDAGGLTQEIELLPAARLSRARHVFLLTPPPLPEIQP